MNTSVSLGMKGVEALLASEKKLSPTNNWGEADKRLRQYGFVDIRTGGGEEWNQNVASQLSARLKEVVVFTGKSPLYNEEGIYRFTAKIENNKQASVLLSQEWE